MGSALFLRSALVVIALQACGGKTPAPTVPDPPAEATRTEQAQLLLFPVEDGKVLLGREVKITPDGAWTIGAARAPGCEVRVERQKSEYTVRRQVDVESLTTVSAGFAQLVSLRGRFGRANRADIDIRNSEILQAETRGPCGATIVDTVFVGRGKRRLIASSEVSAGVEGRIGVATPGVAHGARREVVDETSDVASTSACAARWGGALVCGDFEIACGSLGVEQIHISWGLNSI